MNSDHSEEKNKTGEKISDAVNSICTILGGALLLYPLIDSATKTIIPEMKKLQSNETIETLKLLPEPKEEKPEEKEKRESIDNEIAMLKRKIAEYEEKEKQLEHKPQEN